MAKLIVEVLNARDLLSSNNHHGSASPFVEVDFDGQRQRTQTKTRDLYPTWNEKLVLDIHDPRNLADSLLQVMLYDDRYATPDLLGCVQISGSSVSLLESEAAVEKYPLCKRGFFAHGRGDISLRIYTVRAQSCGIVRRRRLDFKKRKAPKLEEITHHGGKEKTAGEVQVQFHGTTDQANLKDTRPNVCVVPPLYLLRVVVIKARDLAPFYCDRTPAFQIHLQLGDQTRLTSTAKLVDDNAVWNEVIYFIASQEMWDGNFLIINAVDEIYLMKREVIGKTAVPMSGIPHTLGSANYLQPRWYNLNGVSSNKEEGSNGKKEAQILIKLCFEACVQISDQSIKHADLVADHSMKDSIGSLELTILSAQGLPPMKLYTNDATTTTDAYCVVKHGNKWIRTKTIINSEEPYWNEQYVFKVYDPFTTVRIGLFYNFSYTNSSMRYTKDVNISKVFIPIRTLEVNRMYTCYYPLLAIGFFGFRNHGELQVAVRFTGLSWTSMLSSYTKFNVASLLPNPGYRLFDKRMDPLHHWALQITSAYLSKAEPPIKKETVEFMLATESNMYSLRKQKAHFERLMSLVSGITAVHRWFDEICRWRNPLKTIFIHFLYLGLIWYPKLILPAFLLSLSTIGMWNYRLRPINPPHLDARLSLAENMDLDLWDEEFDTFPTSRAVDIVKRRYDRLRRISGRYQTIIGDIATLGEKLMALSTWEDIRATSIFTIIAFVGFVFVCMASFKVMATLLGLYLLRHPWLRSKNPSILVSFISRLPSKMDVFLLT